MNKIMRPEHPRPDRYREAWLNLNGQWDFEIDNDKIGIENKYYEREALKDKINVPFSPEAKLSGIEHTDFINAVWYRRPFELPESFIGKNVILHIDACDFKTQVYVNGKLVGEHLGGYTSFCFDITKYLEKAGNYITIYAEDDTLSTLQASGKQSLKLKSYGPFYTRTTGIWQTVWLEAVNPAYVISYRAHPNTSDVSVKLDVRTSPKSVGAILHVDALYEGRVVGTGDTTVNAEYISLNIKLSEKHLWELGCGRLYDLKFILNDGELTDELTGYFGLRDVALTKNHGLTINGKTVFGRFVLDQGFYPDGIITAPSDEALVFDIKASMECGFNGARLHQKVFEPRYLYHADRLGYMVFGETGNWGLDHTNPEAVVQLMNEWCEELDRDFSHPSIIGWCPFNETWNMSDTQNGNKYIDIFYEVTKQIDPMRPIVTASGSYPSDKTDVHDVHDYEQDPATFASYYSEIEKGIVKDQLYRTHPEWQVSKTHLPIFVSEYGGTLWDVDKKEDDGWGYGQQVKTEEEYFQRIKGLTDALLNNANIFAYCYTQLTDVEQEKNGVMTYDRKFKFAPERFRDVFSAPAEIEKINN